MRPEHARQDLKDRALFAAKSAVTTIERGDYAVAEEFLVEALSPTEALRQADRIVMDRARSLNA